MTYAGEVAAISTMTVAERVARLVNEFDWNETDAWDFIDEIITGEDD